MDGAAVRHAVSNLLKEIGEEQNHPFLVGEWLASRGRDLQGIAMDGKAHGVMPGGPVELVVADAIDGTEGFLAGWDAIDLQMQGGGHARGGRGSSGNGGGEPLEGGCLAHVMEGGGELDASEEWDLPGAHLGAALSRASLYDSFHQSGLRKNRGRLSSALSFECSVRKRAGCFRGRKK
jgi:hypothetical protein